MAKLRPDLSGGRRFYVETIVGDPLKDKLKSLGFHYDREAHDRGQKGLWWIGKNGKVEATVQAFIDQDRAFDQALATGAPDPTAPLPEDVSKCRVYAAVTYQGRRWYVIAEQKNDAGEPVRCRLVTLDEGGPVKWADCADCELVRTYEGRRRWDGRRYSSRTVMEYPTIGSLRRFRDQQKNPDTRRGQCTECGSWGPSGEPCSQCGGEGSHQ